jgi:hypothetical protein
MSTAWIGRCFSGMPVAAAATFALEAIRQADGKGLRPEIGGVEVEGRLRRADGRDRRIVAVSHHLGRIDVAVDLVARARHVARVQERIADVDGRRPGYPNFEQTAIGS